MLHISLRRGLLALGLGGGLASASVWAMPPGGDCGPGMRMGHHGGDCGPGMRMGHHAMMDPAKVDARLDKLKTDLKLTSAQQGAWQRYASFVREQAKQHREQFDKMREQTPPAHAPERLERMSEHMQLRMKSLEAMKEETRRFYDGLSESQKATFDQAMPQPRQGKHG